MSWLGKDGKTLNNQTGFVAVVSRGDRRLEGAAGGDDSLRGGNRQKLYHLQQLATFL
jgi:hypothetical protein